MSLKRGLTRYREPDHFPTPDRVTADYAVFAELSRGLSGGDILNVCVNAIHAGSVDSDSAKGEHSEEKEGPRRRVGMFSN
jgi:hypothetical protein